MKRCHPFLQLPARVWELCLINETMQKFKVAIMMPIFSFWKMNFLYLRWFLCQASFVLWARKLKCLVRSVQRWATIGKVQLEKSLQFLKHHVPSLFKDEMHCTYSRYAIFRFTPNMFISWNKRKMMNKSTKETVTRFLRKSCKKILFRTRSYFHLTFLQI